MMLTKHHPHIGSSFEDFLAEEGVLEDCTCHLRRVAQCHGGGPVWDLQSFLTDIEQVKNEKKSFTFCWMLRQKTLKDSGKGQQWHRSMWNVWII